MRASLNFSLPEDDYEFHAALAGRRALQALEEIDRRCRELLKYGEQTTEVDELCEAIRSMIPADVWMEVR